MKNAGIQVDTPEVLLSHQGLLEVCSFERLKCMEALWLNDNLLTKIEGLDTNLQLKALYLHNNRINTLKGSLKYLKHIEMLALQNNRLTDLEATLKLMEHLTRLEELDMSGNALANELNYRPRVIYRFPRLKVLDRHGAFRMPLSHAMCRCAVGCRGVRGSCSSFAAPSSASICPHALPVCLPADLTRSSCAHACVCGCWRWRGLGQ